MLKKMWPPQTAAVQKLHNIARVTDIQKTFKLIVASKSGRRQHTMARTSWSPRPRPRLYKRPLKRVPAIIAIII